VQGYLRLPNGRTLTGYSHDYKRNGTSTLFAAFEVATGKVTAMHKKRRLWPAGCRTQPATCAERRLHPSTWSVTRHGSLGAFGQKHPQTAETRNI
jgi:hypothetical protein